MNINKREEIVKRTKKVIHTNLKSYTQYNHTLTYLLIFGYITNKKK